MELLQLGDNWACLALVCSVGACAAWWARERWGEMGAAPRAAPEGGHGEHQPPSARLTALVNREREEGGGRARNGETEKKGRKTDRQRGREDRGQSRRESWRLSLARSRRGEECREGRRHAAEKLAGKGDGQWKRAVSGNSETRGNPAGTLASQYVAITSVSRAGPSKNREDLTKMDTARTWQRRALLRKEDVTLNRRGGGREPGKASRKEVLGEGSAGTTRDSVEQLMSRRNGWYGSFGLRARFWQHSASENLRCDLR